MEHGLYIIEFKTVKNVVDALLEEESSIERRSAEIFKRLRDHS